jgi:hypothetical protein
MQYFTRRNSRPQFMGSANGRAKRRMHHRQHAGTARGPPAERVIRRVRGRR